MFQKLFDKIDEFIDKFNEITNLEEFAVNVLDTIKHAFEENISKDQEIYEKTFDEIMQKEGFWNSIGIKLKKAIKSKEEFLKYLLYISAIMNEFDKRYQEKQKTQKKEKELNKIITRYSKIIKELSENKNLTKEQIETEIKKCREKMQREIKNLDKDFVLER